MTDAEIIARVLTHDSESYAVLVNRYRESCLRYLTRMLGDIDDADDAVQEGFVRAFRSLERCRDPSRFRPWLFSIMTNVARTQAGRKKRRDEVLKTWYDETRILSRTTETPLDRLEIGEVMWALQKIKLKYREAFLLKYVEELSYDEISEITGASTSALKMRVKRSCEQLRAVLASR